MKPTNPDSHEYHEASPHIVIVDDAHDITEFVALAVRDEGITSTQVTNPLQVYNHIKDEHPDVVLLDIHMPYLDGWDQIRLLGMDPETSRIPIILMTANHELLDNIPAELKEAIHSTLAKPFDLDELIKVLRQAINFSRRIRKNGHHPKE